MAIQAAAGSFRVVPAMYIVQILKLQQRCQVRQLIAILNMHFFQLRMLLHKLPQNPVAAHGAAEAPDGGPGYMLHPDFRMISADIQMSERGDYRKKGEIPDGTVADDQIKSTALFGIGKITFSQGRQIRDPGIRNIQTPQSGACL